MRMIMTLLAVLCAGALSAQATFSVGGTVAANTQDFLVVDIDFAASATPLAVTLSIAGNSSTDGLDVFMGDLDAIAATGFTGTADQANDAGTGTINLSVTSGSYSGVHQFAIAINSNTGGGPVTYSGTLTVGALSTGAITQAETNTFAPNGYTEVNRLFSRAIQARWSVDSSATAQPMEFLVDFGSVAQSITFAVLGNGDIAGDLEVFEVLANGTATSLGTLTGATTSWTSDSTFTTSSRSGVVRIRVLADTASMDFDWTAILPSTASIQAYSQFTVAGSLVPDGQALHHFTVNFGSTTNSVMVQFSNFVESGSFSAAFFDLDGLAVSGTAGGVIPLTTEVLFLSGQGVKDFLFVLDESAGAAATYNITVDVSVPTGGLSLVESKTFGATKPFQSLFGRAVVGDESTTGADTIIREFNVGFGGTTHTADIWFECDGPSGVTVELFEISGGGSPVSLGTLTPGGSSDEVNTTSSARTGTVRFRVVITTAGSADVSFAVVFDSTVTVATFGPGGGGGSSGGGSDESCSTGTDQGWALLLLAAMCAVAVAVRTRRTAP